jgi:hypothetical protein
MLENESQAILLKRAGKFGRGVRHQPGVMNKLERAYDYHLRLLLHSRVILWYAFEAVTFKLAKDTRYTPDFVVMLADGTIEFRECKGWWREDARLKIKVAAAMFPFKFFGITREKGEWKSEEF